MTTETTVSDTRCVQVLRGRQTVRWMILLILIIVFYAAFLHDSPTPIEVVTPPPNPLALLTSDINKHPGDWDYDWDRMASSVKGKDKSSLVARNIILVRHGHYDFSTGHLTTKGKQQANMTGYRLKMWNLTFDRIIHSNAVRAVQTADIIKQHLEGVPVSVDSILTEGGPVPPKPTISYWGLPERDYFVDGPRLEGAFRKYIHRAAGTETRQQYDILVAHGNIFRFFILKALQLPTEAWMRMFIAHCSISALHVNPDGTVSMSKCGDSGHMPHNFVSF